MKRSLIIIAALAVTLTGCASGGAGGNSGGNSGGATILQSGAHGSVKDQTEKDIHDQAAFQAAWDQVYADQSGKPALPSVDFTKNTVVFYEMGEMKNGGYSIRISRAEPSGTGYAVGLMVLVPGQNCHNQTQEITHPFIFASVPTAGPVSFDEVKKRETPPCT